MSDHSAGHEKTRPDCSDGFVISFTIIHINLTSPETVDTNDDDDVI
jgi:hypothetical protein